MNWRNVKTVWTRELRDQLRDRRTLFMVAVLPLLMYPLMGMSFFQLSQFMQSHTARVLVVGAEQLKQAKELPPLLEGEHFSASLFDRRVMASKLKVETSGNQADSARSALVPARTRLTNGDVDVVVIFPQDFADRLKQLRTELKAASEGGSATDLVDPPQAPQPVVLYNSARDASQVSYLRVERLLSKWRKQIVGENLSQSRVPSGVLQPFSVNREDVARQSARQAGIWSKLLPFIVFVWALTGAFYPAVDLCAGEKERGTLETLLASPASRGEIVWGKLLTVTTFSMVTAILNLIGIGLTGQFIAQQMTAAAGPLAESGGGMGMPSLASLGWLLFALPPIAALFSALSFACASFARSTKEGQYYFMPLFLVTLPLMLMPLSPGIELNLGNSLVPIMGVVLLLRSLMEGDLLEGMRYFVPVTLVTLGCCLLAIRWAVSQFSQESVLFRGDERFDLRLWLVNLVRRKSETPTPAMAVGCVAMILLLQFIVRTVQSAFPPESIESIDFNYMAIILIISQACVLLPALLIGGSLTRSFRKTFLLSRPPRLRAIAGVALLAVVIHPLYSQLLAGIRQLYPLSDEALAQVGVMSEALTSGGSLWLMVALMALLPAVCEELTFRGCILSGLRRAGSTPWAVIITAVAFGAIHGIFQQSLAAAVLGVLIGYLAVVTGSIVPCIVFHAVHNSLPAIIAHFAEPLSEWLETSTAFTWLFRVEEGTLVGYHPAVVLGAAAASVLLLWWIRHISVAQPGGEHPLEADQPPSDRTTRPSPAGPPHPADQPIS